MNTSELVNSDLLNWRYLSIFSHQPALFIICLSLIVNCFIKFNRFYYNFPFLVYEIRLADIFAFSRYYDSIF